MEVVSTLFKKLKKFNKHGCFGKSANNPLEAAKSIVMYGNPDQISKKIENKYKKLSSIIYVTVPFTGDDNFDRSLEIFSKMYQFKDNFINSEVSKKVLKSIIEDKQINYKKLGILHIKNKILKLIIDYNKKKN